MAKNGEEWRRMVKNGKNSVRVGIFKVRVRMQLPKYLEIGKGRECCHMPINF